MKKALISTIEPRENGYRVAQVQTDTFPVASAFKWVDCEDNIEADKYWYDDTNKTFNLIPEPIEIGQ